MTANVVTDVEIKALRRFTDRAGHLLELHRYEPDNDTWGEVLIQEATFLVQEGAAAYCRYVDRLDDAAMGRRPDAIILNFPNGEPR